jgi:uncharacterized iron-regulated protein
MKGRLLLIVISVCLSMISATAEKPAYRIFTSKGKSSCYEDLLKASKKSDIVLFGESHDNPICHWLELELARDLYQVKKEKLVLGAEMFERDNQLLLNEYISGMIRKKDFEAEAKLWPGYRINYAPITDFAREKGIRYIATSIPRRYAAIVNRNGFRGLDSINSMERGLIAPLPIKFDPELKCYKDILAMIGDGMPAHMSENIAKAQAIKDATMGHFIMKNWTDSMVFLHFNGSYHSDDHLGIEWYLQQSIKKTDLTVNILTISTVEQDTLEELKNEYLGKADFIICIPTDMTKTREPETPPAMQKPMPAVPPDPKSTDKPKDKTPAEVGGGDDDEE